MDEKNLKIGNIIIAPEDFAIGHSVQHDIGLFHNLCDTEIVGPNGEGLYDLVDMMHAAVEHLKTHT